MAELIVSGIFLAAGIATNLLFAPDVPDQEGPRLTNLEVTTPNYGSFINIPFGSNRLGGFILDAQEIEEVSNEDSIGGKGGGGGTFTSYTYFLTWRLSFGINGADDVLRIWGDGKIIYDKTGTEIPAVEGLDFVFYPGGATQEVDPGEEAEHGVGNVPAYRHLTSIKFNRMPLVNFGNRPPNLTAEIVYDASQIIPFEQLTELSGQDVSGSGAGDETYHYVDYRTNRLISLGDSDDNAWRASLDTMTTQTFINGGGASIPAYGLDGFFYSQQGVGNREPIYKIDVLTGETVATFGTSGGIGTSDTSTARGNGGDWVYLRAGSSVIGFKDFLIHLNDLGSDIGSITDANEMSHVQLLSGLNIGGNADDGYVIPDNRRGKAHFVIAVGGGELRVTTMEMEIIPGINPLDPTMPLLSVITNFFEAGTITAIGGAVPRGWAIDDTTGNIYVSSSGGIALFDPASGTTLASRTDIDFRGRNNIILNNLFAFGSSGQVSGGVITTIDSSTLETVDTITLADASIPGGDGMRFVSSVWEPFTQSVVYSSRSGSAGTPGERINRVYVNRRVGNGVPLKDIVDALETEYHGFPLGEQDLADINNTALAGISVIGFNINAQGTVRDSINALRPAYFFDIVEEDWVMKSKLRGIGSIEVIPENDLGTAGAGYKLKFQQGDTSKVPRRVFVRFKNRGTNYGADVGQDARKIKPTPTSGSVGDGTIDLPIVFDNSVEPAQIASKWLYTSFNEIDRVTTRLPWRYVRFTASDVITTTFNTANITESIEIRLTENTVGATGIIELEGVKESAHTLTDNPGTSGTILGFDPPGIPPGVGTKLIFLDMPLVRIEDISPDITSAAYVGFATYADGFPGAVSMRSPTTADADFQAAASGTQEVAWASVLTTPTAWPHNRIQEVADGGTFTALVHRRSDAFTSATDTALYNGANMIVVNTPEGVEMIQYGDASFDPVTQQITLSRLLRGRLGTEFRARDGDMVANQLLVLLSNSSGSIESGAIARHNIPVGERNLISFYKGVTIGQLPETVLADSFAYTMRDLFPYHPVNLTATINVDDTFDLTWDRRTRGPIDKFIDNTFEIPLNETDHQFFYEIRKVSDNSLLHSATVDDADLATIDAVTGATIIAAGGPFLFRIQQNSGVSGVASEFNEVEFS